jgi:hypothetical protein
MRVRIAEVECQKHGRRLIVARTSWALVMLHVGFQTQTFDSLSMGVLEDLYHIELVYDGVDPNREELRGFKDWSSSTMEVVFGWSRRGRSSLRVDRMTFRRIG